MSRALRWLHECRVLEKTAGKLIEGTFLRLACDRGRSLCAWYKTKMERVCSLSDAMLVSKTLELASASRQLTANLLAYLGEVDERKLYRQEACSSMFSYCVERLGMSEDEAAARIRVARLGRHCPMALGCLASGKVHLTGLRLLAPHLCPDNEIDVLERATGKTRRQIEALVCELAPKPDAPALVRKVPERALVQAVQAQWQIPAQGSGPVIEPTLLAPTPRPTPTTRAPILTTTRKPAPEISPLAPARYKVQFTAGQDLRDKLERARELGGRGASLESLMERAVELLVAELEKKKLGVLGRKPRSSSTSRALHRQAGQARGLRKRRWPVHFHR